MEGVGCFDFGFRMIRCGGEARRGGGAGRAALIVKEITFPRKSQKKGQNCRKKSTTNFGSRSTPRQMTCIGFFYSGGPPSETSSSERHKIKFYRTTPEKD